MDKFNTGSSNIGAGIVYAQKKNIPVDAFILMTDNELNRGTHPANAIKEYRKKMGINSKMIVSATSVSNFSVSDPKDALSIDLCGFDEGTLNTMNAFIRGDI